MINGKSVYKEYQTVINGTWVLRTSHGVVINYRYRTIIDQNSNLFDITSKALYQFCGTGDTSQQ